MAATEAATDLTADAFAERLFASALGGLEAMSVYVGDRLGWYRSLATDGPANSTELADRTGTHARYVREWLEGQAVSGILVAEPATTATERRYSIPAATAEVMTAERSLAYLGPLPRAMVAAASRMPELLAAYRTGGGVSWDDFGDDARECQADMNRPWLEQQLAPALASVDDIHAILGRSDALIADVGCGAGWSTIGIARAYPNAHLEGYDIDAPSVEMARRNAAEAGLADRVSFHHACGEELTGAFDAVFAFECVHDMPRPVEVLAAVRQAIKPDGAVIIMDEAVADEFTAPGDELERLMYGFSLFVCLPDGMSSPPSVGTGTVMRVSTLASYARKAGFEGVEVLPIEDFGFWRFYRLRS
jgi:SAM-dependent methyltransferase